MKNQSSRTQPAWVSAIAYPGLFVGLLILIFESLNRSKWVPSYLLPSPTQVALSVAENQEIFLQATLETALSSGVGVLGATFFGVLFALLLARFSFLAKATYPFLVVFQTVPIVAIAPLIVVWFGFGGITVRICAGIVALFPILVSSYEGLRRAGSGELELFRSLGATPSQTLLRLRIPMAIPYFFAGLEIAAGLSVIGAIVGEFVAGTGLGSLIDVSRTQQRVDMMFAAVIISSVWGFLVIFLIRRLKSYFAKLGY